MQQMLQLQFLKINTFKNGFITIIVNSERESTYIKYEGFGEKII